MTTSNELELLPLFMGLFGGLALFLFGMDQMADALKSISPELEGVSRLAAEVPRQIANAHTVFNVVNTLLFLGLATWFARLVERLVPDRPAVPGEVVRAKYLDVELIDTLPLALERVRLEILHMGEYISTMMKEILPAVCTGTRESLDAVAEMDDAVKDKLRHKSRKQGGDE